MMLGMTWGTMWRSRIRARPTADVRLAERHGLRVDDPGEVGAKPDPHDDADREDPGGGDRQDRGGEQEDREAEDYIREPHQQFVDDAPEQGGDAADGETEHPADDVGA